MEPAVKKSLNNPILHNESGVTMLEMIAAISLTALLIGVLSQLLFSGIRLWGKQDRAYFLQHRMKSIHQTLYNDLNTALISDYLPDSSVKGDETTVQFWSETDAGTVRITYRYDHEAQIVWRAEGLWGQEATDIPLFKEVTSWKLEYFKPSWKNWTTEWNPKNKGAAPSLIRVTISTKAGDLGTLTFPLKAWHKRDES